MVWSDVTVGISGILQPRDNSYRDEEYYLYIITINNKHKIYVPP